jgi:predicted lipoprotein
MTHRETTLNKNVNSVIDAALKTWKKSIKLQSVIQLCSYGPEAVRSRAKQLVYYAESMTGAEMDALLKEMKEFTN